MAATIRVPYRHLNEAELEMVALEESPPYRTETSTSSSDQSPATNSSIAEHRSQQNSLTTLVLSCTVAAGVQFGWALQLSLLTPYIQVMC